MAQILIRNLSEETVAKLKARASLSGRSLEAEVRQLLTQAVQYDISAVRELRKEAGGPYENSAELIREDREA